MLLPTELEGRTHLITLIRLLLSDYYYPGSDWNPDPKIRPVVHEKQLSGSQIRISIRITPNFELRLPMIITSLLTKFRQNPTSSLWEILLTNKQTNRQTDTRRWLQYPAFRGIMKLHSQLLYADSIVSCLIVHQNPTNSSWETVIRIPYPDFNPDHAPLWTRSSYDHYLPTHQISSKSDQ